MLFVIFRFGAHCDLGDLRFLCFFLQTVVTIASPVTCAAPATHAAPVTNFAPATICEAPATHTAPHTHAGLQQMGTSDSPSNKSGKQRANDAVENNAVERKTEAWLLHL